MSLSLLIRLVEVARDRTFTTRPRPALGLEQLWIWGATARSSAATGQSGQEPEPGAFRWSMVSKMNTTSQYLTKCQLSLAFVVWPASCCRRRDLSGESPNCALQVGARSAKRRRRRGAGQASERRGAPHGRSRGWDAHRFARDGAFRDLVVCARLRGAAVSRPGLRESRWRSDCMCATVSPLPCGGASGAPPVESRSLDHCPGVTSRQATPRGACGTHPR